MGQSQYNTDCDGVCQSDKTVQTEQYTQSQVTDIVLNFVCMYCLLYTTVRFFKIVTAGLLSLLVLTRKQKVTIVLIVRSGG